MARLARLVIPQTPHFITQRGNRGAPVFFGEDDAQAYIDLLAEQCARFGVNVWAWCLLPARVHLLAVPENHESLRHALGEAHRRYTNRINERRGEAGHLWQERFSSFPLADDFILPAAHFIEASPMMAGLCRDPAAFRWSSARAHVKGISDGLCDPAPLSGRVTDWAAFLRQGPAPEHMQAIAAHISTGRPLGGMDFVSDLEARTGRELQKKKPGRKKKTAAGF